MASRRKGREYALQMLYQRDLAQLLPEEVRDLFWVSRKTDATTRAFAEGLFREVVQRVDRIDDLIGRHARHWKLERMAAVDRNVLRLGVCEFLLGDAPPAVVIDEAIEVARKYSGSESGEFVNGILDSVRKELEAQANGEEP